MMPNTPITASRAQKMFVPRKASNLRRMTRHGTQFGLSFDIPQFDFSRPDTHSEELTVVGKIDSTDVGPFRGLAQVDDFSRVSFPNVTVLGQGNGDHVETTPRDQVEIEIIDDAWSVQDPLRLR